MRYNQNGFRKLRSTTQHVLAARRLIEEIRDSSTGKLVSIFIDFTKAFDSVNWNWMRAILLAYNVPIKLVNTIMSLYHGATAKVKLENNEFTDFISLSSGVLQGDTLAPYLFIIVLDYVLRTALPDESLGIQLTRNKGSRSRPIPGSYITDLDFADDIMLTSDNIKNAQSMLSSIEHHAQLVGLNINLKKTEYILVGDFTESIELSLSSGLIKQVKDFKYLGSWLMNCEKDFSVRKELAWNACKKLIRIWKSQLISKEVKINLFKACVESTLLYNAVTWTMTSTLEKKLNGCYTKLLRYALGYKWNDFISNEKLYAVAKLKPISAELLKRKMVFLGHCYRSQEYSNQPVADLLFWDHIKLTGSKRRQGGQKANFVYTLMNELDLDHDDDVKNLMLDRKNWKKRVRNI
jgi:Reverse transcriptase (RNA-dependent DNA polymerase)